MKGARGAVDGDNVLILLMVALAAAVLLVVLWSTGVIRLGGGDDAAQAEIQARVQQFVDDVTSQAFGRAAQQVQGQAGHPDRQALAMHMRGHSGLISLREVSTGASSRDGDTAKVPVTATLGDDILAGELRLVRQGGRWWISEFYIDGRPLLRSR